MRDYGRMFLGLILAGIALIAISLWLVGVHARNNDPDQARPALSRTAVDAANHRIEENQQKLATQGTRPGPAG